MPGKFLKVAHQISTPFISENEIIHYFYFLRIFYIFWIFTNDCRFTCIFTKNSWVVATCKKKKKMHYMDKAFILWVSHRILLIWISILKFTVWKTWFSKKDFLIYLKGTERERKSLHASVGGSEGERERIF